MLRRIVAGAMGALSVLTGLMMLADGQHWYDSTRGVAATGPFNPHFVADVGAAFLAAGLALVACAWRTRYWPAALAGSAFLVFHAAIHIVDFIADPRDFTSLAFIVASAVLALWAALPGRGEQHA